MLGDEADMERYLEEDEISDEEIVAGLRKRVITNESRWCSGVQKHSVQAPIELFPSPADLP